MIKSTDINKIKTWTKIPVNELVAYLQGEGFGFVKQFSTDEHKIFVSHDGEYMINLVKNLGKEKEKVALASFNKRKQNFNKRGGEERKSKNRKGEREGERTRGREK